MCLTSIKKSGGLIVAGIILAGLTVGSANAAYIPTNRDTRVETPGVAVAVTRVDGYEKLTAVGAFEYWWREDRDIIMVKDSRNGHVWKTGLDAPFSADADKQAKDAGTDAVKAAAVEPKEDRLNATYIGLANSLVTAELYDDNFNTSTVSSAGQKNAKSTLSKVEENHYRLDAEWTDVDLRVKVHVFFTGEGINYRIYQTDIGGVGVAKLAALVITPFLGASGGVAQYYDASSGKFGEKTLKPADDGYAFVPDGSGALIRFKDNTVSLNKYVGNVYGVNPAEAQYYYNWDNLMSVVKKEPLMPVFGIVNGVEDAAFVAYADDGAEHMQIVVNPEENMTYYNFAYPRFVYNFSYHQVYNRRGDGYYKALNEPLAFDVSLSYNFLAGGEADYVGMARKYRAHLLAVGLLNEAKVPVDGVAPIRLDFVMSDVKKSVIGTRNVVTTSVKQVEEVLAELDDLGVKGITAGLLGFQKGGVTTGKQWTINYDGNIGGKGDFKALFKMADERGMDVSLMQDYALLNTKQVTSIGGNQAYHANKWGVRAYISEEPFTPVNEVTYAKPSKSAEWLKTQSAKAFKLGAQSATVVGMSSLLISHYGSNGAMTAEETAELYAETFAEVASWQGAGKKINADKPNMYLWKETDRFLNTPVLNTQYILETDTVPFLQLVLNGTIEMFAPYCNFSFYTRADILRMIDYNVYPSFALTYEPAHLLSATNSLGYYSTEYAIYKETIQEVYGQVSAVLGRVKGIEWTDRRVPFEGTAVNSYADGSRVFVNYTDEAVTIDGVTVGALSAVLREGR